MTLSDELRQTADAVEKLCRLHGYTNPETGEWSAKQLRAEAAYLEQPLT